MSDTASCIRENIDDPAELRRLPPDALPALAGQLREELIQRVARSGGHLSASLGTVELTVALHYVFDTPGDSLVWDVGHQGYVHKLLTGRRERFATIRRRGGLSGFLRRDESPYDAMGAGHSSTSISTALGIAVANARQGNGRRAVAIIGDGAMTAGLAFEALHHAGATGADLLIVLNDNGMSISPNVGALAEYLARIKSPADAMAPTTAGQLFEDLGIAYSGPCDGHDVLGLVSELRRLGPQHGPRLLHVRTRKGHGYAPAEADPIGHHGVTPFDPSAGHRPAAAPQPTYTDVFGDWLCEAAHRDPRVVAITPAMREGSGLVRFAERFPDRFFDVGIAEQHCVAFAAGLAAQGLRPVVAIYSTFLQRAYDQLIHDVALQGLPVLFAIDRAGVVGPDGATHNGAYDLSFLRCVPGITVMTPSSGAELRDMLRTGLECQGPAAVRYPRAAVPDPLALRNDGCLLATGTAELRRLGKGLAFLAFGSTLGTTLAVADQLDATVVNMRFVKPLDERLVLEMAARHSLLVTVEENVLAGGAGSAVAELLNARSLATDVLSLGLPDRPLEHATRDEVLADAGLDRHSILQATLSRLPVKRLSAIERREPRRASGARATLVLPATLSR